jgi:hypothetical protein
MMIVLIVVLLALAGALCAVLVLVSLASRREDRAWTLAGPAPDRAAAITRRILGFHATGVGCLNHANSNGSAHTLDSDRSCRNAGVAPQRSSRDIGRRGGTLGGRPAT